MWSRVVPTEEVERIAALQLTCTWRGSPFLVTRKFDDDGIVFARLFYLGRDAQSAEAAGLQKTDAGVYEASAPLAELESVQGRETA